MDWLRGEEEAQSLTPPPARATTTGGKMGFNLPLCSTPQTENMIAPALEMYAKQESRGAPEAPETHQSAEGGIPAGQDCRDTASGEAPSSDSENKEEEEKSASRPPKDGTPVWRAAPGSEDWCNGRLTGWAVYDSIESSRRWRFNNKLCLSLF